MSDKLIDAEIKRHDALMAKQPKLRTVNATTRHVYITTADGKKQFASSQNPKHRVSGPVTYSAHDINAVAMALFAVTDDLLTLAFIAELQQQYPEQKTEAIVKEAERMASQFSRHMPACRW